MSPVLTNRRWTLKRRPAAHAGPEDVVLESAPVAALQPGQIRLRNHYLSLDPAIRDWMSGRPSYLPPIALGDVVRSTVVGEVVESRHPRLTVGQLAVGLGGWEELSVLDGDQVMPITLQPGDALHHYLSIYGAVGLTPYFGLLDAGRPQAGETVLVSAAAGAVGSLVGQIARLQGCRAVGLAGTEAKCRWIVEALGFDQAIPYRDVPDLQAAIGDACPGGVDIYYDNVGGTVLDAALMNMNRRGRIVFCGAIATYNTDGPVPGPYNYWQVLARSLRVEGYLVSDYLDRFPEGIAQLRQWVEQGALHFREQIIDGLEQTLEAFDLLFDGRNDGKLMIRLVG